MAERLKITTDGENHTNEELEVRVKEDVAAFEEFFTTKLGNSPLAPWERAPLQTYLMWKLGAKMTG